MDRVFFAAAAAVLTAIARVVFVGADVFTNGAKYCARKARGE